MWKQCVNVAGNGTLGSENITGNTIELRPVKVQTGNRTLQMKSLAETE